MIRKLFLIFVCMWLLCGCASATDYYVSPTGTGDGLTIETPGDPSTLDASLVAGDTMYFLDGTYQDKYIIPLNGTSYRAYNGTPILQGSTTGYGLKIATNQDITIDGLTISNYQYCVWSEFSHDITITNCTLQNSSTGTIMSFYHGNYNCTFQNNTIRNQSGGGNAFDVGGGVSGSGRESWNISIINNQIYNVTDHNGLNFKIYNNVPIVKGLWGLNVSGNVIHAVSKGLPAAGSVPLTTNAVRIWDSTFQDNIIYDCGRGMCVDAENCTFTNNSVADDIAGAPLGLGTNSAFMRNTTLRDNPSRYDISANDTTIYNASKYSIVSGAYTNIVFSNPSSIVIQLKYNSTINPTYPTGTVFTVVKSAGTGTYTLGDISYTNSGSACTISDTSGSWKNFTLTKYDYSAVPATGTATITPRTPVGSEICNFTAESTNENAVTFVLWGLTPGYQYSINEDGSQKSTQLANETGMISWVNSEWSEHVYTVEDTGLRLPVCAFTANATDGTAPKTIQFTDASTQTPTSWSWDFNGDDVEDSTEQNPVWIYDTDGSYDVSLTVTNAIGSDTEEKIDYIILTDPYVAPIILTTVAAALLFMRARRRW